MTELKCEKCRRKLTFKKSIRCECDAHYKVIGGREMTKRYKITYKQRFMGKILTDSYIKHVSDYEELLRAEQALYEDPHIFSVKWEELPNE